MENDIQDSSCADGQELQTTDLAASSEESFSSEQITDNSSEFETKKILSSEIDQDLYKEVLEKLDIVKRQDAQENPLQPKLMQEKLNQEPNLKKMKDLEQSQTKIQIEKNISQDFEKIQKLMKSGLINSVQGQNLKKQVLKKAFDKLVQTEKVKRNLTPVTQAGQRVASPQTNKNEVFEEFSKSNPDFFTTDGRKEVLDYLKSDEITLGKDELSKISNIIRTVEKAAIDKYLKKVSHEKTLRDSNEIAKQRLTANAQKSAYSDKNLSRTFTREQIGKMSSAEFTKYEPYIMEQLKKGLIK